MGTSYSILIDAYGWTPKESIRALDAKIAYKYNGRVSENFRTGEFFVMANNKPRKVHIEKSDTGLYRAYIKIH